MIEGYNETSPAQQIGESEVELTVTPNPFRDHASINLRVEADMDVVVEVYDMKGAKVATLHKGMIRAHDSHVFTFTPERAVTQNLIVVVRTQYGTTTSRILQTK